MLGLTGPQLGGGDAVRQRAARDRVGDQHRALGVVFQVRDKKLMVLLWQRAAEPFAGAWVLPGGLLAEGERLGAAASRHLAAKVNIPEIAHLEQLETRSDPARDPRGRVLATA